MNLKNSIEEYIGKSGLSEQMRVSLALNQRKIWIYDYVDSNSIFECLFYLQKIRNLDAMSGTKEPIEIYINSGGGVVYDGLTLVSLIEEMKEDGYDIITINASIAFSMGFILAICGSTRKAYRYSSFMTHDVTTGLYDKLHTMIEQIEQTKQLNEVLIGIILKYTSISREEIEDWLSKKIDKYFNATEALEKNIIDVIL